MGLTQAQAKELSLSLGDVFTPDGDAGVIALLHTFRNPRAPLYGKGQCAKVDGRQVDAWYPISELESSETLRGQEDGQ